MKELIKQTSILQGRPYILLPVEKRGYAQQCQQSQAIRSSEAQRDQLRLLSAEQTVNISF